MYPPPPRFSVTDLVCPFDHENGLVCPFGRETGLASPFHHETDLTCPSDHETDLACPFDRRDPGALARAVGASPGTRPGGHAPLGLEREGASTLLCLLKILGPPGPSNHSN